jgi:hypothetical protein
MKLYTTIFVLMFILLNPTITLASWIQLSPEELVEKSKLAVIGEYIGTTRVSAQGEGKNIIVGVIKVETFLYGTIRDDFVLIAIRNADSPFISSTINFKKGQRGLWLLPLYSPHDTALYSANHPQQFTPLSDVKTINQLKKLVAEQKQKN